MTNPIPFIDLAAQQRRLGPDLRRALDAVLAHGQFILGPEVAELEGRLQDFCGAGHAVTCASGTDALLLGLMALEVGAGDAVLVPGFTFAATAEAVVLRGATPVFVDVRAADFNIDPDSLAQAVAAARQAGLRPRAVVPVDLFGQPADYDAIGVCAAEAGLAVLADAAQSFGARYRDRAVGTLGDVTAVSFFPSKPLGCYGDGGAVFTDNAELAGLLRSQRVHGQGADKNDNQRIGLNSRLDTLQAAVLLQKLTVLEEEHEARQAIAARYDEGLRALAGTPAVGNDRSSAWALYTLVLPEPQRDRVAASLAGQGIPTGVYYPRPLHRQPAYAAFPTAPGGLPVCERLAKQVLSLPMHPYLDGPTQARIVAAVRGALA